MHGRIPAAADHFTWKGLYFEVVDMDGRRVDKLLIHRLDNENASGNTPDESAS
jgi:putative hemolysin